MNRQVPEVDPVPLYPSFSAMPSAEEIRAAHVFGEPLIPFGPTDALENRALADALLAFLHRQDDEEVGALERFLSDNPGTRWRVSLLLGLGGVYRRTGRFLKAFSAWEEAWHLGKDATAPEQRAIAEAALGELLELNQGFGRMEPMELLLSDLGGRRLGGSAAEKAARAREGAYILKYRHETAVPSGATALDRIQAFGNPEHKRHPRTQDFHGTLTGADLDEIRGLSEAIGRPMKMVKLEAARDIPVPAVVHWKLGHYSAIVKTEGGRYYVEDPLLGDNFWVSVRVLREEGSGYYLTPSGPLPRGFRPVGQAEAKKVRGKCTPPIPSPPANGGANSPGGSCPMAQYSFHLLQVGLHIWDTPIAYTPPIGPAPQFRLSYAQREQYQPAVFPFSNFGPKWRWEWLSYVEDNPTSPAADPGVILAGGGKEVFTGYDAASQSWALETESRAQLVRTSTSPIRYERRLSDGSKQVFGQADGAATSPRRVLITETVDPQGNKLTYTYDGTLRLVALTDALGLVSTLSYENPSYPYQITKVADPFGRFALFEYHSDGRLAKITDPIGITSAFAYGANDWILSMETPYGITRFTASDAPGVNRVLEAIDPLGGKERLEFVWKNAGYPATEPQVPTGFAQSNVGLHDFNTYYWDKLAMARAPGDYNQAHVIRWLTNPGTNLLMDIRHSEKRALESRIWYAYAGQPSPGIHGSIAQPITVARLLDSGEQITRHEYNSLGKKTRETDPIGRSRIYVYDPSGIDLLEVRVSSGQESDLIQSFTYNSQHQPLAARDAAGLATTYTYNTQGQVLTVMTPQRSASPGENRTTTYGYANGYLQGVTSPGTPPTVMTYDTLGRVQTSTDSDGYKLTYDYDALDRSTRTTYPDSTYEETQYDKLDPAKRRDRLGRWTQTFYDALRRVTATRDPAGRVVTQQWCTCGSLEKLIDPNGNATTWERDIRARVTKETRADGSFKTFEYETKASRLKRVVDAKNQEIHYAYALDDKLLQTSYVAEQIATPDVSFSYTDPQTGAPDAHGRLRSTVDGTGTTTYSYHPLGVLGAGQLQSVDGPLSNDVISYGYDELGRVTSRTLNGVTTTWAYDALGRLTTLGDPIGNFTYAYLGTTGRVSSVNYPNGQATSYAYLPVNQDLRLQEIHHKKPGGVTLNKFNYTYDAVGNILTWAQQTDTNPAQTYSYEYDRADQLTAATLAAATPKRYRYGYDPAGNRTVEQIDNAATLSTHDNMNRLLTQLPGGGLTLRGTVNEPATVTVGGQPAPVSGTNQFSGTAQVPTGTSQVTIQATDPSGNVRTNVYELTQTGATKNLTYDPNGNLTGDGVKTYEWDANNKLVAVKQGASTLASFSYDGTGRRATKTVSAVTTMYVYDGRQFLEERPSAGSTKRYVYGPGIDQPLAQVLGATTTYNVADHLGSVVRTTDSAGNPTLTREYDPWGNLIQGSATSGYAFTGREWDAETSLYYYRARYYDPKIARFASEDPIGLRGGPNFYSYVNGAPVTKTDPLGLAAGGSTTYAYYICCYKGQVSVCGGNTTVADSCLRKCALDHEAVHLADVRPCHSNFCKGKPDKTPVTVSEPEQKATECNAWRDTLECIKKCPDSPEKANMALNGLEQTMVNCGP